MLRNITEERRSPVQVVHICNIHFFLSFLRGRCNSQQSWWKLVQWRLAGFILGRRKLGNCICYTNTVSWTWCVTTVWFIMWISTFVWSR